HHRRSSHEHASLPGTKELPRRSRAESFLSPRRSPGGMPMPPKIARLAGLGAFGACAGFVALFAFVAWLSAPTPTGGINSGLSIVVWVSLALVVVALIGVHVAIGKQLLHVAKGDAQPV